MGKKVFWNSDKIVSICAILISLMTLIVFIYQTRIIREQQRMSVLPYLSIGNHNGGQANYKLVLSNNGLGPAFVVSFKVIKGDEQFEMDLPSYLYKYVPEMDSINHLYHANIIAGQLIPAGQDVVIFEIDNSMDDAIKLFDILNRSEVEIELIYESAYGDRWKLDGNSLQPQKIN